MEVRQLLDNIIAGRTVESQEGFNQILREKIEAKKQLLKVEVAKKLFGGE